MHEYEVAPCSIFQSPRPVDVPHQPRAVEDETPHKEPEDVVVEPKSSGKKKSCLSLTNPRKEIPAHPALRRKTVAFGKTVNVSQTIEGTSRLAKKTMASNSPMNTTKNGGETRENREDLLKIIHDEMAATRKEIQEENSRKQEELNAQNLKMMQEMMSQFLQQITVTKPAIEDKENSYQPKKPAPKPVNKITLARRVIQKEGKIPPDAVTILEKRLQSDPLFRQTVDDVLAEAEYEYEFENKNKNNEISRISSTASSPPPISRSSNYAPSPMYTGGANPSKLMRETLTVERSVHFDNGLTSIDTRQKTTNWPANDRYRNYEPPDPVLQSTYQPGSSVSYYPSASATHQPNGFYVEHVDDDVEDYESPRRQREPLEGREERERRIREKYARRK